MSNIDITIDCNAGDIETIFLYQSTKKKKKQGISITNSQNTSHTLIQTLEVFCSWPGQ